MCVKEVAIDIDVFLFICDEAFRVFCSGFSLMPCDSCIFILLSSEEKS